MKVALPGTKFIPSESESKSLGEGNCLYNAVGNSMQNAGVPSFGTRARNLTAKVKALIAAEVDDNEDTREAMDKKRFFWEKEGLLSQAKDYVKNHTYSESTKAWGTSYDLHLLARALEKKRIANRIVVYSYGSKQYTHILPLRDSGDIPTARLQPADLEPADVVITNRGNTHWSPTRYDEAADVGPAAEEAGEGATGDDKVIVLDSDSD